ncbi:MAG: SDR family NAD(P)-dependent oxidoreductase [bacterium]
MKRAVIIGASSGIGRELAKTFSQNGCSLGLAARRLELLETLKAELAGEAHVRQMDVSQAEKAVTILDEIIEELGGMDLIIISAGVDLHDSKLDWNKTEETININAKGFAALANAAFDYFSKQSSGHIVGISSIAGLRGSADHPAYSASKAFVSNYLEGLRMKTLKSGLNIHVTDIRPGNVDTPMTRGHDGMFWAMPAEKAARQIFDAVRQKKKIAYVTKRWGLIARIMRVLPDRLLIKF